MKPISARAYARHRGCALSAIQEAIRSGRLRRGVRRTGSRWHIDPVIADAEWLASTHSNRIPLSGPTSPRGKKGGGDGLSLAEARARLDTARALLAELDLAERRGELLDAKEVEAHLASLITRSKAKLLGIPSRVRQQDPTLTAAQIALVEDLIREALEDLASEAPLEAEAATSEVRA